MRKAILRTYPLKPEELSMIDQLAIALRRTKTSLIREALEMLFLRYDNIIKKGK